MIILKLVFVVINCIFHLYSVYCTDKFTPDSDLNTAQIIIKYGYPYESYQFKSEDNYLISLIRIPHGKNSSNNHINRVPVLLVHGGMGSAANWVLIGVNNSLGFRLADQGYDVWLINLRGTDSSRNHLYLDPNDMNNNFFDYSFHEIAYYDIPKAIDVILNKSEKSQLIYIGLSEGTTIFFAMTSTKPKFNEKIKAAVILAPAVYLSAPPNPIFQLLKENQQLIKVVTRSLNIKEIGLPKALLNYIKNLCMDGSQYQNLCLTLYQLLSESDRTQINKHWISAIVSHLTGVSTKTFFHYLQIVHTDYFRQFDYGPEENKIRYGQASPPSYNLTLVTPPMLIMYAPKDLFANKNDMKRLTEELPNVIKFKDVEFDRFTHTDFAFSADINKYVNNDVIDFVNNFTINEI